MFVVRYEREIDDGGDQVPNGVALPVNPLRELVSRWLTTNHILTEQSR